MLKKILDPHQKNIVFSYDIALHRLCYCPQLTKYIQIESVYYKLEDKVSDIS